MYLGSGWVSDLNFKPYLAETIDNKSESLTAFFFFRQLVDC